MIGSDNDLVPVARTTTDRWYRFLERRGTLIEMSAETGVAERLVAPVAAAPLAEIELELLKGDAAALFDIADRLNATFDGRLRLSVEAKRDKALRAGRHRMPREKERRTLSGDAVAGDVLSAALKQCAADIVELSTVVVESHDGEAARRLRVALRRLRAAEKAFRPLLEDRPLKKLAAQARDLARVVGAVRDLDLFVVDSLPLAPAGPLRAKLEAERARLSNVAAQALSGADFGAFAIDLMRASWLEDWRRDGRKGLAGPAREFADGMLERCFSKLAASAATADFDEPRTLHPLRIELKKFRYAAQFFRDFHDGPARKQSFAAMSALQDALGAVNDAVTAVSIADREATGGGAVIARAAGFIAGCRGIEARERAAAARNAWAALAAAPAYWRPANDPSTDAP
jgi:CHAD domain-containing protein